MRLHTILLLALTAATANAETITGRVVKVSDGDTIKVAWRGVTNAIRFAHIDAPEKDQLGGGIATIGLKRLVYRKKVYVVVETRDRYRRVVGDVWLGVPGEEGSIWVNLYMVRAGLAWHYTAYSDSEEMAEAMVKAQEETQGIWGPITDPAQFRRDKKAAARARREASQ